MAHAGKPPQPPQPNQRHRPRRPASTAGEEPPPASRFGRRRHRRGGLVQTSLRQGLRHRRPHGQTGHERGLQGVVDVRVARPGAGGGLIVPVELVDPHTRGLDEALLRVVDPGAVAVLVVLDLDLSAAVVEQCAAQSGSGADALADHPVHALVDDRRAVEVRGVDEAGSAVHAPAIGARTVEELLGGVEHPIRHGQGTGHEGGAGLNDQARPFQAVARRDAVGPEGVGRLVLVVVQIGVPARVVVLRQVPVVGPGLDVDGEVDDLDRAREPGQVAGDV